MPRSPSAEIAPSRLVTLPISRATLALAGPTTASLMLQAAFAIVDMFWVGRLGAAPLAAINVAAFVVWTVDSLAALCSIGTNALVARHVGAGDYGSARETATSKSQFRTDIWRFCKAALHSRTLAGSTMKSVLGAP